MATIVLFVIALIVILAISRYNEDDRLFWKLLGAFAIMFTVTTVAQSITTQKEDNGAMTSITTTMPSQIIAGDSDLAIPALSTGYKAEKTKQEWPFISGYGNYDNQVTNHVGNARGQPCCNHSCICNKDPINKVGIQDDS